MNADVQDAGLLREQLARELAQWRAAGYVALPRAQRFWQRVAELARALGRPFAHVLRDLQRDAEAL